MSPELEVILKRKEAAAKAQYEHLLVGKKWEDESLETRSQWIASLSVALDAADEAILNDTSLMSYMAELLGGIKFPNKEWDELQLETQVRLKDMAQTVVKTTQGK